MRFSHPGVTITSKSRGGVLFLRWFDPRENRRQKKSSAGTKDFEEAIRIAHDLSLIIKDEDTWDSPPDQVHPRAADIWGAPTLGERAKRAVEDLKNPRRFPNSKTRLHGGFVDWDGQLESVGLYKEEIKDLLGKAASYKSERDAWRHRALRAEGYLKKMGRKIVMDQAPIPISDAIKEYLKDGTGSRGQFRDIIGTWLRRLAREVGENKNVFEINEEDLKKHLAPFSENANFRQTEYNVRRFLTWATKESFRGGEVLNWAKLQKKDDEPLKRWYWLTSDQVKKLIEKIREKNGDYWSDASQIQYALGLRPEEIPLLQASRVSRHGKKYAIELGSIHDGSKRVRRLKTKRSHAVGLQVPSFAEKAIERRLAAKGFLLFPCDAESAYRLDWSGQVKDEKTGKLRARFSKFEIDNKIWPSADDGDFSSAYRSILRRAGKHCDPPVSNLDSRTLRRTCGREMVLKYGFDHAAALLRDDVQTLKKHYADLLPSDVNTER